MRHVPYAYFPIFICCSPVHITGILLSLQKGCHKGIYLETSFASRSLRCCPHPDAEALCSLLHPHPALCSLTPLAMTLTVSGPGHSIQGDTWGEGAKVICQCFSNWAQGKQYQEGHQVRAAPGPRASLLL